MRGGQGERRPGGRYRHDIAAKTAFGGVADFSRFYTGSRPIGDNSRYSPGCSSFKVPLAEPSRGKRASQAFRRHRLFLAPTYACLDMDAPRSESLASRFVDVSAGSGGPRIFFDVEYPGGG